MMLSCVQLLSIIIVVHTHSVLSDSFNKYVLIQASEDKDAADNLCQTTYGTQLASIHSWGDWNDALTTMQSTSSPQDVYIGLVEPNRDGNWVWLDGTP